MKAVDGKRQADDKGEKRDKGRAGWERESCAPWPPIFIHQWGTYGNCLSESKCMVGWLLVKEAIMCFSSRSLAQSLLCAERGRVHTVILPSSIIHAFLLSVFSPKPVCLDGCTNSYQRCPPNVISRKKDLHRCSIRFSLTSVWGNAELISVHVTKMHEKKQTPIVLLGNTAVLSPEKECLLAVMITCNLGFILRRSALTTAAWRNSSGVCID